jgi:CotS family spore coat protein
MVKIKNYVKSRKRKNEFEMKFQSEYPHFTAQAQASVELLAECEKNSPGRSLCHGDFNQHNVVNTGHGWQIVNFEKVNYSSPISDLSNFLRKMMEKNDWDKELGLSLIRAYDRVRPLSSGEYRQLYALLLFPEKFWKLANHYYNSHKAWVSGRNIEKLDRMMEQEGRRGQFLDCLCK